LAGLSLTGAACFLGTIPSSVSLASRFSPGTPGIVVALADRISVRALVGPRETLRLILSLERTRSSVLSLSFLDAGPFFAGAPGFVLD
jgi:hypothetical protein